MLRRRRAAVRRAAQPVRRTNVQRSAEMQTRILRATIECLIEHGYAAHDHHHGRASAPSSRAAPFCTTSAPRRIWSSPPSSICSTCATAQFRAAFARVPADADRAAAALDLLWRHPRRRHLLRLARARRRRPHRRAARPAASASSARAPRSSSSTPSARSSPRRRTPNPFFDTAPRFVFALLARSRARSSARHRAARRRRAGPDAHQASRAVRHPARRSDHDPDATATQPKFPSRKRAARESRTQALLARLSRQSVHKRYECYRDIDWDAPEFRIDAADSRWELPADRSARRHRLVPRAAARRARAHRPLSRGHVHEGRAAVRERAQPGPFALRADRAASTRPSSATPITSSSRSRTTR